MKRPTACIECKAPIEPPRYGIRVLCEQCRHGIPRPSECKDCGAAIQQPKRGKRTFCLDCARLRQAEHQAIWYRSNRNYWRERKAQ